MTGLDDTRGRRRRLRGEGGFCCCCCSIGVVLERNRILDGEENKAVIEKAPKLQTLK